MVPLYSTFLLVVPALISGSNKMVSPWDPPSGHSLVHSLEILVSLAKQSEIAAVYLFF